MDKTQRFQAMQTELGFLRAEMEMNRRYIFERPLVILAGGVTAAATLGGGRLVGFDVLPILFTVLMGYNLWFTHNRLESNARIISYLQVIHTPAGAPHWIGWEAALRRFRESAPPAGGSGGIVQASAQPAVPKPPQRENRFYGPILSLHMVSAVVLTGFLLAQEYPAGIPFRQLGLIQQSVVVADALAVVGMALLGVVVRPATVRHTIEGTRQIWERVLLPPRDDPAPADGASGGRAAPPPPR